MLHEGILILDYGSQYTQLIARRVREAKVFCEIHPAGKSLEWIEGQRPKGIILSGGPSCVYDDAAPGMEAGLLELGVPVLGVCYGMQLMAHVAGGDVEPSHERQYGPATIHTHVAGGLFAGFEAGSPGVSPSGASAGALPLARTGAGWASIAPSGPGIRRPAWRPSKPSSRAGP